MKMQPCETCRGAVWVLCPGCGGTGQQPAPPKQVTLMEAAEHEADVREARILMRLEGQ